MTTYRVEPDAIAVQRGPDPGGFRMSLRITKGRDQYRGGEPLTLVQSFHELKSGDTRHPDIGDDQVKLLGVIGCEPREHIHSVGGFRDLEAVSPQGLSKQGAHRVIVLGEEDPRKTAPCERASR